MTSVSETPQRYGGNSVDRSELTVDNQAAPALCRPTGEHCQNPEVTAMAAPGTSVSNSRLAAQHGAVIAVAADNRCPPDAERRTRSDIGTSAGGTALRP